MVSMRIADSPNRGARVAYAVLAVVAAGLVGGVLLAVLWPLVGATGACRADQSGLCGLVLGILVWILATVAALGWTSYALRLGSGFWGLVVAGALVSVQLGIELVALWPALLFAALLVVAALVTDPGGHDGMGRLRRWLVAAAVVATVAQFGWWVYSWLWA